MKVMIAGAGAVGTYIAEDLTRSGHDVLVFDTNRELVAKLSPGAPYRLIAADACEVSCLQEGGVEDADVVVAATGDDEDNLVISLLAKQEFAVPRVIARVNHPKNRWLFNEAWGVDVAVSTPHLITALVEEAVTVGSLVHLFQFVRGDARLVEVTLGSGSPAIGRRVADLALPRDAVVVAIVRSNQVVFPQGDSTLAEGDEVLALVTTESESEVTKLLVSPEAEPDLPSGSGSVRDSAG